MKVKQETDKNLREIAGKSEHHEEGLAKLQMELQSLALSDAQSKAECERLR